MHVQFGDYHVRDIEFVAAFDVDAKKVGLDLAEAIGASENNTIKIADVPPTGVTVQRGHTLDGLGKYYRETIEESDDEPVDVVAALREAQVDVLVCYLPVGSEDAAKFYAQCAIDAKVALRQRAAGLHRRHPGVGGEVHAPPACRSSATTSSPRSARPSRTACWPSCSRTAASCWTAPYQLNVGGNMDFMNMLERERLESKKISKTQAVTSQRRPRPGRAQRAHRPVATTSPWLDDRKWAYVRLEGRAFGDVPLNLEYKLEVWDSPNSAGVIIDARALREDRQGPRHRRPDPVGVVVLHEVPAGAVLATTRPATPSRRSSPVTSKGSQRATSVESLPGVPPRCP